jgi:hypothetical protein
MKFLPILAGAALAVAAAAPAQAASDTVLATAARSTPVDAGAGHVLYSAWDGSAYRLTDAGSGALPVRGAAHPFRPDIGRDAHDHAVAVYPRCTGDETGCDLYLYDFTTRRERRLRHADSPSDDEVAGAVWRDTLVFARVYHGREGVLSRRSLSHAKRSSHRLARQRAASVDLRGTRAAFSDVREWSREPWLAWTGSGTVHRLTRVPGSGAAVDYLEALNPTSWGSSVYWLLVRAGEGDVSVLHRYNRSRHRDERVAGEIPRAASGFGYDAGAAYYAVPQQAGQIGCVTGRDCPTDIHRVDGLTFEKAPPIELH